jgi:hypothetical protein
MSARLAASVIVVLVSANLVMAVVGASARPQVSSPRTILNVPTTIYEFAQDGSRIAWLAPDAKRCAQRLVVRSLKTGRQIGFGVRGSRLCSSGEFPTRLALANDRVVYGLETQGNTEVDGEVVTAAINDKRGRVAYRYAFDYGQDYPEPDLIVRGDGSTTLALATGVPLDSADYGPCPGCNRLWRIDARGRARRLTRIASQSRFALAGNRFATPGIYSIELRDLDGRLIRVIRSGGAELLGLSAQIAVEVDAAGKLRVYSPKTGRRLWSTQLSSVGGKSIPSTLSVAGNKIVYSRGKRIFLVDTTARQTSVLATASSRPIGLSIEGNRVAWAENVGTDPHLTGRIRAIKLRP